MAEPSIPLHSDRLLLTSPLVQIGEFRCDPSHPRFAEWAPTNGYCYVFPRNPLWIEHEGGQPFVADPNVVPLYNAGHPYRRGRIATEGARTDWFSVTPAVLREMLRTVDAAAADADSRLFRFDFGRVSARTFLKQRDVVSHVRTADAPDLVFVEESALAVLDEILCGVYGAKASPAMTRAHRDLAEEAKSVLAVTFATRNGLSELARAVGTSVFHLCRVFRQHSGFTIHRYRNELRLRTSLELLDEAGDDILAIAVELGYSGHSHFTAAFHRAFGLTPSSFRHASRATRAGVRARAHSMARSRLEPSRRLSERAGRDAAARIAPAQPR